MGGRGNPNALALAPLRLAWFSPCGHAGLLLPISAAWLEPKWLQQSNPTPCSIKSHTWYSITCNTNDRFCKIKSHITWILFSAKWHYTIKSYTYSMIYRSEGLPKRHMFLGVLGSGLGRGPVFLHDVPLVSPSVRPRPPQHKHRQIATVRANEAPNDRFRGTF